MSCVKYANLTLTDLCLCLYCVIVLVMRHRFLAFLLNLALVLEVTSKPLRKQFAEFVRNEEKQLTKPLSALYPIEQTDEVKKFKV